jgi:hypothetical protein
MLFSSLCSMSTLHRSCYNTRLASLLMVLKKLESCHLVKHQLPTLYVAASFDCARQEHHTHTNMHHCSTEKYSIEWHGANLRSW